MGGNSSRGTAVANRAATTSNRVATAGSSRAATISTRRVLLLPRGTAPVVCARVGVRRAGGDRRAGARELLAVTAGARVGFQFHCRRVVCAVLVPSMVFFSSKMVYR